MTAFVMSEEGCDSSRDVGCVESGSSSGVLRTRGSMKPFCMLPLLPSMIVSTISLLCSIVEDPETSMASNVG